MLTIKVSSDQFYSILRFCPNGFITSHPYWHLFLLKKTKVQQ